MPRSGDRKLTSTTAARLAADIARGMTKPEAAAKYGVSVRTVYRTLRRDDDRPGPRAKLKPCGTTAAYRRHLKAGERCVECSEANAVYEMFRSRPVRPTSGFARSAAGGDGQRRVDTAC